MFQHYNALPASRDLVDSIHPPAVEESETGRLFVPLRHRTFLNHVHTSLDSLGLRPVEESYSLARDGLRLFGTIALGLDSPDVDYRLILGLRNCNDRSASAGVALGSSVMVCDNLMLHGEYSGFRRHTRFIRRDVGRVIFNAINTAMLARAPLERRTHEYKRTLLSDCGAHDLLCRGVRAGALSSQDFGRALRAYHEPPHPEFEERTLWSLQNAVTEAWKAPEGSTRSFLPQLEKRSRGLQAVLDRAVALA